MGLEGQNKKEKEFELFLEELQPSKPNSIEKYIEK